MKDVLSALALRSRLLQVKYKKSVLLSGSLKNELRLSISNGAWRHVWLDEECAPSHNHNPVEHIQIHGEVEG